MTSEEPSHAQECEIVRRWLVDAALPFWCVQGIDGSALAHEEFGFDGKPREPGFRRSLVQFRQVYVLAHAALMGHAPRALSCELFHRAAAIAWHKEGGFVHKLAADGLTGDSTRESYDQAFGMLATAWAYAVDGLPETLEYAYRTLRFLDEQMASVHGGYVEALPTRLPRRQNPHMHLFEAFLALYEVTNDELFLSRAAAMCGLLESRFVCNTGALREYFDDRWQAAEGLLGEVVEPGHHFEWVWLLHQYARLTHTPPHPLASQLFDFAVRHGLDANGQPIQQMTTRGVSVKGGVKLWALTEQLKAHVVRAEASGKTFDAGIVSIVENLSGRFLLRRPAPLWYEEIAEDGTPERRRMPASTLYHITLAAMELLRWQSGAPPALASVRPR